MLKKLTACMMILTVAAAFMPATASAAATKTYDMPTKAEYYTKAGKTWKKADTAHYIYEKGRIVQIHYNSSDEAAQDCDPADYDSYKEYVRDVEYGYDTKITYRYNGNKLATAVARDSVNKMTYQFNGKGQLKKVGKQKVVYKKGWIARIGKQTFKYTFKNKKPLKIKNRLGYVKFNNRGLVTRELQTKLPKGWWGTGADNSFRYKFDSAGRVSVIYGKGADGAQQKVVFKYEQEIKTKSYKRWLALMYQAGSCGKDGTLGIVQRIASDEPMYATFY